MNTSEKFQDFLSNIKIPDDYTKKTSFFRTSFLLYYKHIFRAQNLFYKKHTLKINAL